MSMKDILKSQMKRSPKSVIGQLDQYLFRQANKPNDRAIDVNAPSSAGGCLRAAYYRRKQIEEDGSINPRLQRIFDNGTKVHERLQEYLLDMGLLIMDEVPLINDEYNIQGHTDGYLDFGDEVAILEIKSINDNQFSQLKDAKFNHKCQGGIYMFCAEERRKYLRTTYKDLVSFHQSEGERVKYFESHYQHIVSGSKYTREEKIANEVELNLISDDVLWFCEKPVSKVVFLYENKNNQELKEFIVPMDEYLQEVLSYILQGYKDLNQYCASNTVPPRDGEATSKNCMSCKWCSYKNTCWVV